MSKLADVIRRGQRVESAPMGFGAARLSPKPSMLVGFAGSAAEAAAAREAGADIVVIDATGAELIAADAKKARESAGDLPFGIAAKVAGAAQAKELQEAGLDFFIFDAESTSASALLSEELGYVLELPESPEELFLRSLETLSLEAVLIKGVPSPFTVAKQMEIGRVAALAHKPLFCQVPAGASSEDLECLRAAGVIALLVSSASAVAGLKETVAALPVRKPRRDERTVVSLPRGQVHTEEDDDDDEP